MTRVLRFITVLLLLAVVTPAYAQNNMRFVPPSLVYNDGACALVTGGGVGPLRGGFCYRTDNATLYWWDGTSWVSMVFGASPTLTSPTVTSGLTVAGGATITGGLTLDTLTLTSLAKSSLVFTNTLGVMTTTVGGTVSAPPFRTVSTAAGAFQLDGDITLAKTLTAGVGPGYGMLTLRVRPGTNPGSCKLVAAAGTSTGEVVVQDNIGSGC